MTIRTILASLSTPERSRDVLTAAIALARKSNAHLIGLHVTEAMTVYPGIALHMVGPAIEQYEASQAESAAEVKAVFDSMTDGLEFVAEWRLERAEVMPAPDRTLESSRAADIIVVAQPDPAAGHTVDDDLAEMLIRRSGRPVLMAPRGYKGGDIGSKLLIGWSGSREATRAAHDALTLADDSAEAFVLTVARGGMPDPLAEQTALDLAQALARHGLAATTVQRSTTGGDIVAILNREALERGADLIVTGAFGHSRMYDFVIGAVTRDLLEKATLPVLFSK